MKTLASGFDTEVNRLWPPEDGNSFEVEVIMDVTDDADPNPIMPELWVEVDEPLGDDESINIGQVYGRGHFTLQFPAQRLSAEAGGNGRCYTLRLHGLDAAGNSTTLERVIGMPLDQPDSLMMDGTPDYCGAMTQSAAIPVEEYTTPVTPWGTTKACARKADLYCAAVGATCASVNVFKCTRKTGTCKNKRWFQLGPRCQCR